MAAGRAAEKGAEVWLLEKMAQPGKKILISGKTRCNLTNAQDLEDFILYFGPNGRFLYSAFSRFFRDDLLEFMKKYGVETKLERGGRIFPASDNSQDVVKAFKGYLAENKVKLLTGVKVTAIKTEKGEVAAVQAGETVYPAKAVILATGGASFPATGSTGDGFRLAQSLGHTDCKIAAGTGAADRGRDRPGRSMQGVSLKNVRLTAYQCRAEEIEPAESWKQIIDTRMGEMMFTHFGIGGPITLQMSLDMVDALEKGLVSVAIDLKPALDMETLQLGLQRDFDTFGKRGFQNLLKELVPQKMILPLVKLSGIPAEKRGNQISAKERDQLADLLKSLRFNIKSPLPLSSAMVTAGGVSLKEIDPRTMASRLVKGLYFCGEVMDIDADTGGYNLQAAFSTGYVAGESAEEYVL